MTQHGATIPLDIEMARILIAIAATADNFFEVKALLTDHQLGDVLNCHRKGLLVARRCQYEGVDGFGLSTTGKQAVGQTSQKDRTEVVDIHTVRRELQQLATQVQTLAKKFTVQVEQTVKHEDVESALVTARQFNAEIKAALFQPEAGE